MLTHQLPYMLPKLDVDATVLEAQVQKPVGAALVTGVQLLLPRLWITSWRIAERALVIC